MIKLSDTFEVGLEKTEQRLHAGLEKIGSELRTDLEKQFQVNCEKLNADLEKAQQKLNADLEKVGKVQRGKIIWETSSEKSAVVVEMPYEHAKFLQEALCFRRTHRAFKNGHIRALADFEELIAEALSKSGDS